jgi:hypothetical protein
MGLISTIAKCEPCVTPEEAKRVHREAIEKEFSAAMGSDRTQQLDYRGLFSGTSIPNLSYYHQYAPQFCKEFLAQIDYFATFHVVSMPPDWYHDVIDSYEAIPERKEYIDWEHIRSIQGVL